jgi:hypothetical protein
MEYPVFQTGTFKIDSSFSSSSGLDVNLGMKPGYVELKAVDVVPSSSSDVVRIDRDFNDTRQCNYTLTNSSTTNTVAMAYAVTASSSSNAITVKDGNSVSTSSSSSVITAVHVVPLQGFNIANGLASGSWKGKTIHYKAFPNQRFKAHGTLGA